MTPYLTRGHDALAAGDVAAARAEYEHALKIQPFNPVANLELGKLADSAGDVKTAVTFYVRAAAPNNHMLEPQVRLAQILLDLERVNDAGSVINSAVAGFPGAAEPLALRAELKQLKGQSAGAVADANDALGRDKGNAKALTVLATQALTNRDSAGALQTVQRGLATHPDDVGLLQVQAAVSLTLDQPDKAADALRTIIRRSPRNVAARSVLADLQAQQGHLDAALQEFEAAARNDPGNETMQLAVVKFLSQFSQEDRIGEFLSDLIAKNPKTSGYDFVLAEFYREHGAVEKARAVLSRTAARLAGTPQADDVQIALAKADASAGRNDLADTELEAVLRHDPKNRNGLLLKATLLARSGRTQDAVARLLDVVRDDPVNAQAFQVLAEAYMALGRTQQALEAERRAIAVLPDDASAQLRLATFLQNGGDIQGADDVLARVTLQNPNMVEAWAVTTRLAVERKDWGTATRSLARLKGLPGAGQQFLALSGQYQAAHGDLTAAIASLQSAVEGRPDPDPDTLGALARAYAASKTYDQGIAFLERQAAALKGSALTGVLTAIATLNADAGHDGPASAAFDRVMATGSQDLMPYQAYATFLMKRRDFAGARAVIARALRTGMPESPVYLLAGDVEQAAGNMPEALNVYRQALKADPLSLAAANNFGSLLADQDPKNVAALTQARDSLNGLEDAREPLIVDTIAWLDYRLGRVDEAKALLARIKAGDDQNPELRFHLAAVLLASGDRPGGLALLDSVKGLDFPGSDEVRALSAT